MDVDWNETRVVVQIHACLYINGGGVRVSLVEYDGEIIPATTRVDFSFAERCRTGRVLPRLSLSRTVAPETIVEFPRRFHLEIRVAQRRQDSGEVVSRQIARVVQGGSGQDEKETRQKWPARRCRRRRRRRRRRISFSFSFSFSASVPWIIL